MRSLLNFTKNLIFNLSNLLLTNGFGRAVPTNGTDSSNMSGFSSFIQSIMKGISRFFILVGEFILKILARIAYFICKICLSVIDFFTIVIKNLAGQASSYNIKDYANLKENDILFKFLLNEYVLEIFKDVLIFSLLLLIIFTIVAIVNNEWKNATGEKVNSYKKVLRKTLISLFSLLIVPIILIIGIIFSNVILSSTLSAISGQNGSYYLGPQIFEACSYEANRFRSYASNGQKIPIVFDYNGSFENVEVVKVPTISSKSVASSEESLKKIAETESFSKGQATYNMFKEETFYNFDSISNYSSYYDMYDGPYLKTQAIEYFVMADLVDYAMSSGVEFYVKNVEDVYIQAIEYVNQYGMPTENLEDNNEDEYNAYKTLNLIFDCITPYDSNNKMLNKAEILTNLDIVSYYSFNVYYNQERLEMLRTDGYKIDENGESCITYSSVAGSTDEVTGAKYIYTLKTLLNDEGAFVYVPFLLGVNINGYKFTSNFLAKAQADEDGIATRNETMFLARGVFNDAGYPTAIRQSGSNIIYYRHNASNPNIFNFNQIYNYTSSQSQEGVSFGDITEFLTGVDVSKMVPEVEIQLNLNYVFTKDYDEVSNLSNGCYRINYSFVNTNLHFFNLYNSLKINYVLVLLACIMLFKCLFFVILGLVKRLYEITLLWITLPGWISKFPIEKSDNIYDRGTALGQWKNNMVGKVLSLFGVYVGISLVLVLIPIVFEIDYITSFNIKDTNLFDIFNADIANFALKICFLLVLFNFLKPGELTTLIESNVLMLAEGNNLVKSGEDSLKDMSSMLKDLKAKYTIGGIKNEIKGKALNVTRKTINAIPGKNFVGHYLDSRDKKFNVKNDKMLKDEQADFLSKASTGSDADILKATTDLTKATNDHEFMEGVRIARRDYWRDQSPKDKDYRKRNDQLKDTAKKGGGAKIKVGGKNVKVRDYYKEIRKNRGI